ncbi:MAG: hypothetical protein MZV70_19785 [Desulfobacterales bacterium]|nr:hypothetical protein [Desulfobacterales bacterium]
MERELETLGQPFIVMPFKVDAKSTLETILLLQPETNRIAGVEWGRTGGETIGADYSFPVGKVTRKS